MKLLLGLVISIVLGGVVRRPILWGLRKWMRLGAKPESTLRSVPFWITGAAKRLFFALLVAYDVAVERFLARLNALVPGSQQADNIGQRDSHDVA